MVQHTANMGENEPDQREMPSEIEHLFQITDILDTNEELIAPAICEVVEGDEAGRTLLHRANCDESWAGFFRTRLFLKAIKEPYKGNDVRIDSDLWIGKKFRASVIHNKADSGKIYANLDVFNFDERVEQVDTGRNAASTGTPPTKEEAEWDENK